MKPFAIVSFACFLWAGAVPFAAAVPAPCPTVAAIRSAWPIAREPSGSWGVVGEVSIRPANRAATVRSVTFTIENPLGRTLSSETFDTPATLAPIVGVFTTDAAGGQVKRPDGSLTIAPADTGVVYLAGLVSPPALPRRARVTVRFVDGLPQTVAVPLDVFNPGQRLGFPLGLDTEPWVATNSAGTAHHWVGGTLILPRTVAISQRFAIDFVQIDASLETHPAGTAAKEAYYAWDEPVRSPGDGKVVSVLTGQRDLEIGEGPDPAAHPAGNHVVIQYGPSLFAVFAHLQQGSVALRAGDRVARGQVIGRVGNSGNTSEPHLHVHYVDRWAGSDNPVADFYISQGVPALFWGGQVIREGTTQPLPLRGASPLEFDLIVRADRP